MAKQNKGLAVYQSFMKRMKRDGLTYKQAKAAWRKVRADMLRKAKARKKTGRKASASRTQQFGPTLSPAHAKRLAEAKKLREWEEMQKRVAHRKRAAERLARIKGGAPGRERQREKDYKSYKYYGGTKSFADWLEEERQAALRDKGGRRPKKGKGKKKAAGKKRKATPWNRFMAKHRRAGMSMKAIGRLWRKSGQAAAKPKKKAAKGKKKAAKRDPGWWKHPRLHGKAAHKGWLRHKRRGF